MTPAELSDIVVASLRDAATQGTLSLTPAELPASVTVERPKRRDHGDYATNVALQLAKRAGMNPRELAQDLAGRIGAAAGVASVEVAGPGFLNISLDAATQGELARTIVEAGDAYGVGDALGGVRINLEFISANPTGPLHLGHTRWAAVGDALARVLAAAGAEVTREFYINDRGAQMDLFGASLAAAAHGRPVPENGYHGQYVIDLARELVADDPSLLELEGDEALRAFLEAGYTCQLGEHQRVLEEFRTYFDVWYSERSLHESGAVERGLARLREQGHVFEADGAEWLRTTDFGDDRDRVLVRRDGEPTYFASDTAYYVDKRARGFDVAVYLLGADHHGYVGRLKAAAACTGDDPRRTLVVLIGQLVKILQGGAELTLSKRAGTIITLSELVELIGVDSLRYSLIRYPSDSPLTLDIEVITRQAMDNPVFYVQYVAARTASVSRNAAELGLVRGVASDFRPELLEHERENDLLGVLGEFPRVVTTAAELREPHRVARYLEQLAGTYHRFYDACRILPRGDEEATDLTRSRLWLNDATHTVIANGLALLGVDAPQRM